MSDKNIEIIKAIQSTGQCPIVIKVWFSFKNGQLHHYEKCACRCSACAFLSSLKLNLSERVMPKCGGRLHDVRRFRLLR